MTDRQLDKEIDLSTNFLFNLISAVHCKEKLN